MSHVCVCALVKVGGRREGGGAQVEIRQRKDDASMREERRFGRNIMEQNKIEIVLMLSLETL